MNLSLKFREHFVGDLFAVGEEFDQLLAALNARLPVNADGSITIRGPGGSQTSKFKEIEVTDKTVLKTEIELNGQIEFLRGPWLFDTPNIHRAVLRPPDPAGTYNDYDTQGLDEAIGIELEPTAAVTITGISNPTRRKRLLFIRNRDSTNSIVLKDNDAGSIAAYRMDLPDVGSGAGGNNALLDASHHTDTVAQAVSRGSLIYGNTTPAWDELVIGAANRVLRSDGTDVSWAQVALATDVSGDLPFANLTQIAGLSVLGVTGGSTADVAAITAASDHQVLRRSGSAVAFGAVNLAQSAAITGVLPEANGGTGSTSVSVFTDRVVIPEASLEALNTTPYTLVAAAGASVVLVPLYASIEVDVTDAYTISITMTVLWNGTEAIGLSLGVPTLTTLGKKLFYNVLSQDNVVYGTFDPRNQPLMLWGSSDLTPAEGAVTAVVHITYLKQTVA